MDQDTITQVLALITGAWTLYQEIRHRKKAKAAKPSVADALGPQTPVRRKK